MTILHLKLKDLDEEFIRELQAEHHDEDAEVVIHVHSRPVGEILSEEAFWQIIGLLDWDQEGDDEAVVEPVVAHLAELPVALIYQFLDKLSEKLYLIDTRAHAENSGDNAYRPDARFSVDLFLYDRCCVVANGRQFFEDVIADPTLMPKDMSFEPLLYVASDAYQRKTGKPMEDYLPAYNYETFSNVEGWEEA